MLLRPKKSVRMSCSKLKVTEEKQSTIHKSQTGFWFKKNYGEILTWTECYMILWITNFPR